jgi:hypothetical protein
MATFQLDSVTKNNFQFIQNTLPFFNQFEQGLITWETFMSCVEAHIYLIAPETSSADYFHLLLSERVSNDVVIFRQSSNSLFDFMYDFDGAIGHIIDSIQKDYYDFLGSTYKNLIATYDK